MMKTSQREAALEPDYRGWSEHGPIFTAPHPRAALNHVPSIDRAWFPGADLSRRAPIDGGSILGGQPKLLWHDTETSVVPSYSTGFFPHMTVDLDPQRAYQHIPATRAARALRNLDGGVQTNRWNVFQVEVIGWVNRVPFAPILRDVALWAAEALGVPLECRVEWLPYDASFGRTRVRLTGEQWLRYTGHLGHMHAPENQHGDPGWPFPIDQILQPEGDPLVLDADTKRYFDGQFELIRLGDDPDPATGETHPNLQSIDRRVGQLSGKVDRLTVQLEALAKAVAAIPQPQQPAL